MQENKSIQTQPQVVTTMSPEDALIVLDQAASLAMLNRADHVKVHVAVQTIRAFIEAAKSKSKQEKGDNAR